MKALWQSVILLVFILFAGQGAQASDPLVELTFEETQAVPGQPLTLRMTVLVPTWLPKPVVFPSLEAPNLRVTLPEGSTGPTSRSVDGETWSGVTRRYILTPMVPGAIAISGQELIVTWAEVGRTDPLETVVPLETIVVEGILPEGAEGLDPFIAAQALSLTRDGDVAEGPLAPGDSVTLTVTAKVEGISGIFLPPLLPVVQIEGIAAYPAEPEVSESSNRGETSGARSESITLLAESGGGGRFPDVTLDWYNLTTKKIETASLEGFDLEVDGPLVSGSTVDPRRIALLVLVMLCAAGAGWGLYRWLGPLVTRRIAARRARHRASEAWAYRQICDAVARRDFSDTLRALDLWSERCADDPRQVEPLQSALSALGALRYGQVKKSEGDRWSGVKAALAPTRIKVTRPSGQLPALPPLNPTNSTV